MNLEKRQKFSIRKFSVGVASVVVGQFFVGTMQTPVRANEVAEVTVTTVVETPKQQVGDISAQVEPQPKEEAVSPKKVEQPSNHEVKPTANIETITSSPSTVAPEVHKKSELDVTTLKETAHTVEEKPKTSINEKAEEPKIEKEKKEESKQETKEEANKVSEDKELEELKVRYSNTMIEIKALNAEAEQLLKKVRPSELSKAGLQATYQLAKQEETAAQAFLSKENLTKAELQSNLERLETVLERLYSELKANGHSGDVRYMLDASTVTNEAPYMTMERYFGLEEGRNNPNYKFIKDGSTVELKYKIGLTNIEPNEVELTPDAKRLGFTFNDGGRDDRYLTKTLTLDNTIESKTYVIGLQSKTDSNIKITATLTIEEPPVYKIVEDYGYDDYSYDSNGWKARNNRMGDSVTYDEETSTAYMTSTPFGYYLHDKKTKTIADATPDSPQYTSNLWLSLLGRKDKYNIVENNAPITITKFEQTGGSPGVTVEFITDKAPTANNVFAEESFAETFDILTGNKRVKFHISAGFSDNLEDNVSPYRINFKTLPDKAGTYFVEFNVTDSLGRVTKHHLNLVTREISQTTPNGKRDSAGNYTLTNADVMLDADKLYRVTNPIPVAVPISDKEQNLGNLVLNKANATLTIDSKPDGVEITKDAENPTKFKIIKQNGHTLAAGVYTITATAKDGHFGANVPARTYKFEVMDGLNNIGHQTWTEGQTIPNIPVSMTNGSKITSLSVETGGDYIHLTSNADYTGVTGYALKKTDGIQTAYVTATYTNNEGQSRQIKTKFTYEVMPSPVTDLSLEISNDKQTVSEGTKFKDMAVTATEGAKITVGTLPAGVSYDTEHKVLSGVGQYEGHYVIPVTATKDNKSITKLVDLTVTPGNFNVPTANYTFTAGERIPSITLNIPANATVDNTSGSLPEGLSWSEDKKTITGTPTQVGTFTVNASVKRTTSSGTEQSTTATINITINSVPLNFSIPDNRKEVKVLDELPPIKLQADGAVLSITSGSLPPGVNYDATTKTISGTPTKVGTYTATFTATSPTISGNSTASATLTINVTPRNLTVDVTNKEQEKDVLSAIDNVVLTPSDNKARLEVDTSQLPPGVTYDSESRTISGKPSKVGEHLIPYKATFSEMGDTSPVDGGHIKINVRPLPVSINVTEKEQTVRVGTAIKNMVVTHSEHSNLGARYLSVDLPESDLDSYLESTAGLNYNPSTHTITGTPTKPGVYKIRLKASIDSPNLGKGSAEEIITVTVVDDPVSLDIKNDRQMIALGKTNLRPITFTVPADATLTFDKTKLPEGVTYDEASKTISGTPTVTGAFDIPVTVTSVGGKSITKDITIDVVELTPTTPTVTVKENNDGTHTITISQPNGQPVETIIKNGKDGETPKVKVERDETKKETRLTFYSDKNANDQFDEGTDTVLGTSVIKDGQDGATGAKGEQGLQGRDGQNGRDGKDILSGTNNPAPQDGKDGDTFINTATGEVLVKKDGEWKSSGSIKGEKGEKGDQGLQGRDGQNGRDGKDFLSGTNNPAPQDGKDGDTFINTATGEVLVKKDGEWKSSGSIKGEKGDQGLQGRDGRSPRIELRPIYPAQPRSARRARSVDEDRAATQPVNKPIGVHIIAYYDNDNSLNYNDGDELISEERIYNGVDGKSPTITTRDNGDGSHTITITNADGTTREIVVRNGTCNCNVTPTSVQPKSESGTLDSGGGNSDGNNAGGNNTGGGNTGGNNAGGSNTGGGNAGGGNAGGSNTGGGNAGGSNAGGSNAGGSNTGGSNVGGGNAGGSNAGGDNAGGNNAGGGNAGGNNAGGGNAGGNNAGGGNAGGNNAGGNNAGGNNAGGGNAGGSNAGGGNAGGSYGVDVPETGTLETPRENRPEYQVPPTNTPNVIKIETTNQSNNEMSTITLTTTGVNISNERLPETGTQSDAIYIALGSGILLSIYMGKRKEDSSSEM